MNKKVRLMAALALAALFMLIVPSKVLAWYYVPVDYYWGNVTGEVLFDAEDLQNYYIQEAQPEPVFPTHWVVYNPIAYYDPLPGGYAGEIVYEYNPISFYSFESPLGAAAVYYEAQNFYPYFHAYYPDYNFKNMVDYLTAPRLEQTAMGYLARSQYFAGRDYLMTFIY